MKLLTFLTGYANLNKSSFESAVFAGRHARVAQLVERDLAKVEAAGSSPVSRSFLFSEK